MPNSTRPRLGPLTLVSWAMSAGIVALAAAGLATQAVTILTGRDFVFGLIPAFDPAASRNLPAWFGSMALVGGAAVAAFAAAATAPRSWSLRRAWWLAAGLLVVLSIDRFAPAGRVLAWTALGAIGGGDYVAWAIAMITAWFLAAGAITLSKGLRARLLLAAMTLIAGTLVCASAPAGSQVFQALAMTTGRVLEMSGLLLFVRAAAMYIGTTATTVTIRTADGDHGLAALDNHVGQLELRLSPGGVHRLLLILLGGMLSASALAAWMRFRLGTPAEGAYRFLFVDFEGNLPTWFSSVLLLACGAAAGVIARRAHRSESAHARAWMLMALALVALSADEAASFHELLILPLRALLGGNPWLRYPLIVPGVAAIAVGATVFSRLLKTLDASTRRGIYRAAGLFFFGALVVETVGGWFDPTEHGESLTYDVLTGIEEACEMLGATLLLTTLMRYAETQAVTVSRPAATAPLPVFRAQAPSVPATGTRQ